MTGEPPGPDAPDGDALWEICIMLAFAASMCLAAYGIFAMAAINHTVIVHGYCAGPTAAEQSCRIGMWSRVWVAFGMLLMPVVMIVWGRRRRPLYDVLGRLIWVMGAYLAAVTFVLSG